MAGGNQTKAKTQHERFIETARSLGCDEDEAAFDKKLRKLVPPKTGSSLTGNKAAKLKPSKKP